LLSLLVLLLLLLALVLVPLLLLAPILLLRRWLALHVHTLATGHFLQLLMGCLASCILLASGWAGRCRTGNCA
jgi:hypothetical protein